jgi:hypothetical protein
MEVALYFSFFFFSPDILNQLWALTVKFIAEHQSTLPLHMTFFWKYKCKINCLGPHQAPYNFGSAKKGNHP